MRMTEKRRAWLRQLADHGPQERHSKVGYDCMKAGWTEWNYRDNQTGKMMTQADAKILYGEKYWDRVTMDGERITDAGRAALAKETSDA